MPKLDNKVLQSIIEDIRLVHFKRSQRAGKPGVYRVFINDDGNVVAEIFNQDV